MTTCNTIAYSLLIDKDMEGKYYEIKEYPELEIICHSFTVSLCPSFYGKEVMCFRQGGINLKVYIAGVLVELKYEDSKGVNYTFNTKDYKYNISTVGLKYKDEKLYLLASIRRCNVERMIECSFDNPSACHFKVGDIFKIKLPYNSTVGTFLEVRSSSGLDIINKTHKLTSSRKNTGGGGTNIYTIRARETGEQYLYRRYNYPGKPYKEYKLKIMVQ